MFTKISVVLVVALISSTKAFSLDNEGLESVRLKRSLQPGAPSFPGAQNGNDGWKVNPNVNRDENGNTQTSIGVQHTGPNHDVQGQWSKVIRGPNRSKPSWNVGGSFRFKRSLDDIEQEMIVEDTQETKERTKRSLQPGAPNFPGAQNGNDGWKVNPNVNRDGNGNTQTSIGVQHTGPNHDVQGQWSKVIRGPNKSKPSWNVGGSFRFKRSLDNIEQEEIVEDTPEIKERTKRSLQPGAPNFPGAQNGNDGWKVNPNVNRDGNGNTQTSIGVQHTGPNHDVQGQWSKVIRGPNKSKPNWNVGGSFRFKRSLDKEQIISDENVDVASKRFKRSDEDDEDDYGWKAIPHISRDEDGNTNSDVRLTHKGTDHEFNAEWSKVVRGPARAKPVWNIGGNFRF